MTKQEQLSREFKNGVKFGINLAKRCDIEEVGDEFIIYHYGKVTREKKEDSRKCLEGFHDRLKSVHEQVLTMKFFGIKTIK